MSKYESWDQDKDADDIFSAADQLLGLAMADLTYTGASSLENPYKRSAKAQEPLKSYNKPDPKFDYLLNLGK